MTTEPTEPFESKDDFHEADMRVFYLAGLLEAYAQAYSTDYAEGIDDGCGAGIRSIDYGGKLTTVIEFTAERYRDEPIPGVLTEEVANKYDISVSIRHECPDFMSFPQKIREYVEELGEYDEEDLAEQGSLFSIEFEQAYTVYSDGEFESDYHLWLYVGEDQLSLIDVLQEQDEDGPHHNEVVSVQDANDELFSTIFSAEEIAQIGSAIKRVKYEQSSEKILDMFLEQISNIRFIPKEKQLKMAENIVDGIFCDTSQAA